MAHRSHVDMPVRQKGKPLAEAKYAMIMLHGRGTMAENILSLADELDAGDFAYLAPQAAEFSWYPNSFLADRDSNQPGITNGLQAIANAVELVEAAGIPREKTMLLGFSQGGCLMLEFAARNPGKYGGIAGLSGGLIGPVIDAASFSGNMKKTPVFLGCSDIDFHIPKKRVEETAEIFEKLRANVILKFYRNGDHTVNRDEIETVRQMMDALK